MNILNKNKNEKFSTCVKLLNFQAIGNEKGFLVALEEMKQIPFDMKRMYYIYGIQPNITRGHHAHKNLKQVLIAISGSVDIICEYENKQETYTLSSRQQGLLIEGLVWRTMKKFSDDAVLLVIANDFYKESDYIREYDEFLKISSALNISKN
ncbi:sugar 3,4-ketoisomerase [Bartonella tamiae]|uniref:Sugar 3,4-ketoisomerase QdtA cupin domain-containing protein n=1 Tax=Bartonella tamiae Th239 TaxID=1094558 RepID=J1JZS5_9HYPH|nr:FdtA/QdtA family cupin domain-containing protein [Bartonella tamiae]EJF90253.1 hypothetical protein ME5_00654 [Bartonella tamiae Th239]EJF90255.1 hypothetical protein ME5_00656 [Bartonella tamiae Th239]EJF90257.1 hypothetical protein ME5_00658 [Bartonella tamiae Th239]EJF93433.1 hypothetical protein MEG_01227 [Bartonella tamiae Th307]